MNTTFTKPKRLTNKKLVFILLLFFLSTAFSCKEDPPVIPPPPQPKLTLAVDDVSCTEAWLSIKLENITLPVNLELKRDSVVTKTILAIYATDTTLYVDSLLPNQTYKFQSVIQSINHSSNEVSVATMDTTSHNFTWQTFEFGEPLTGNSSVLYDVAIIDENNIWAVGAIYMNDSLGETNFFNAVRWDGNQWELKKISVMYRGSLITPLLYGVFAFSATEIWISSGVPIKGDGNNWVQYHLFDMGVLSQNDGHLTKIWGTSTSDLFYVGALGTIAHYNGSQWTKIESGTTLTLIKVHGNSAGNVYASGGSYSTSESVVLKLNGVQPAEKIIDGYSDSQVDTSKLFISQLYGIFSGPWVDDRGSVIMGGSFIYRYRNNKWSFLQGVEGNYPGGFPSRGFIHDVSGNSQNDFCIAGEFGSVQHYNGINAVQIGEPFSFQNTTHYYNVDMKGDIIVTVGKKIREAVITVYRRQ